MLPHGRWWLKRTVLQRAPSTQFMGKLVNKAGKQGWQTSPNESARAQRTLRWKWTAAFAAKQEGA